MVDWTSLQRQETDTLYDALTIGRYTEQKMSFSGWSTEWLLLTPEDLGSNPISSKFSIEHFYSTRKRRKRGRHKPVQKSLFIHFYCFSDPVEDDGCRRWRRRVRRHNFGRRKVEEEGHTHRGRRREENVVKRSNAATGQCQKANWIWPFYN